MVPDPCRDHMNGATSFQWMLFLRMLFQRTEVSANFAAYEELKNTISLALNAIVYEILMKKNIK